MTPISDIQSLRKPLKISLCTACMGRLDHLQQTLSKNIETFKEDPNIEFCVMAYGDRETADTVEQWAKEKYPELVEAGRIRLGYTEAQSYHASHAKNLSHLLSSPDSDVICNIDADNFVQPEYIERVKEVFNRPGKIYLQKAHIFRPPEEAGEFMEKNGEERLGHMGRLAMRRKDFVNFGYEERIQGWGGEDTLISKQMQRQGFTHIPLDKNPDEDLVGKTIPHKDITRTENMSDEAKEASKNRLSGTDFPSVENYPTANPDGFGHAEVNVILGKDAGIHQFGVSSAKERIAAISR